MALLRHGLLVAFLLLLGAGCDGAGSFAGFAQYSFETEAGRASAETGVEATFTNKSKQTTYVFYQGCLPLGIERQAGPSWTAVGIPIFCTMEVKPILSVKPGESLNLELQPWVLEETDLAAGTYRLTLSLGDSKERENLRKATSDAFVVEE